MLQLVYDINFHINRNKVLRKLHIQGIIISMKIAVCFTGAYHLLEGRVGHLPRAKISNLLFSTVLIKTLNL